MHSPLTHVNFLISVKKQDFMAQSSFKEVYMYFNFLNTFRCEKTLKSSTVTPKSGGRVGWGWMGIFKILNKDYMYYRLFPC